jgi:hypothetical protein
MSETNDWLTLPDWFALPDWFTTWYTEYVYWFWGGVVLLLTAVGLTVYFLLFWSQDEEDNKQIRLESTGTGDIRLITNGSDRIIVDPTGQVGIGRPPHHKLDVNGQGSFQCASGEATTARGILFNIDGTDYGQIYAPNGKSIAIQAGVGTLTDALVIDQSGNVKVNGDIRTGDSTSYQFIASGLVSTATAPHYTFSGQEAKTGMYLIGDSVLGFTTDGTERMRIDSAGYVGFYNTLGTERIQLQPLSGSGNLLFQNGPGSINVTGNHILQLLTNNTARITINSNGTITFPGYGAGTLSTDSSGNISASSDSQLKSDIQYFDDLKEDSLYKISQLKPCRYKLNSDPYKEYYEGFIAQDVETVIPQAVDGKKYQYQPKRDEDNNILLDDDGHIILDETQRRYRTLNQTNIIAHLVKGMQELKGIVDIQATTITDLTTLLQTQAAVINDLNSRIAILEQT